MKTSENELLFHSRRKVGFLGMYSAALAVIKIYEDYVKKSDAPLRHLLTYKLSQDYLGLFFCAIRARSGWCPNPTCMQFKSSYKRLLIHHEVKGSNGNTTLQHKTKILTVSSGARKKDRIDRYDPEVYDAMVNLRVAKKYELTDGEIDPSRTKDILNVYSLPKKVSEFSENSIAYICGYVIRKIWKKILCEPCRRALICLYIDFISKNNDGNNYIDDCTNYLSYHNALKLILTKSKGNLIGH